MSSECLSAASVGCKTANPALPSLTCKWENMRRRDFTSRMNRNWALSGKEAFSTGRQQPVEMKGGVMRSRSARLSSFSGFICVPSRIGTCSRAQTARKPLRQHLFALDKISADLVAPPEGVGVGWGGGALPAVPEHKPEQRVLRCQCIAGLGLGVRLSRLNTHCKDLPRRWLRDQGKPRSFGGRRGNAGQRQSPR